jgi:7-methyl-GTP pyrophosphatase
MTSIILASSSPYRRELLDRLGIPFETWPPEVDERPLSAETPPRTAQRLARAKAEAAAARWPAAWIIGSDQVADLDGSPLGKPGTHENARAQLRALSGNTARFHTALCLFHRELGRRHEDMVTTEVTFRTLSDAEIERYLAREDALDCAGSAKSEALGISLLARLAGGDPTALVGLPLIALSAMLRSEGFEVP